MANLQVRDMDDRLYESLKRRAELEHRSLSQEVVWIIEKHLQQTRSVTENNTLEFLNLTHSWIDSRSAEAIIQDLRSARFHKNRRRMKSELFD